MIPPAGWNDGGLRIAHLSDLHVRVPGRRYLSGFSGAPEDNNRQLADALAQVTALGPDLLVLTGDLADTSDPEEYALLAAMLRAVPVPIRLIPGNHDRWSSPEHPGGRFQAGYEALRARDWPAAPASSDFYFVDRFKGWELVAIDTSRGEQMSAEQRRLIPQLLASSSAPCVVLSHSPLLPVGNAVDRMSFHDREFLRSLSAFSRVKVVLSGHAHKRTAWELGGVVHLTAPSTSYGIGDAPGFALLCLGADGVLGHSLPPTARFTDSPWYDPAAW